ncbi:hypothetical protein JCM8097_007154 [Rhodosporidiobolus ruineniae]
MAKDEPLLPTKSPTASNTGFDALPTPNDSSTNSPLARLSRRWQDPRRRRQAAWVVLSVLALWLVVRGLGGSSVRRAQERARRSQSLVGFSESRLQSVPVQLRAPYDLPVADLLGHPLLTVYETPSCRLNTFQQDRYAPLLPSYGSGGRRARSRQPHDLPRNDLTYFIALNLFDSSEVVPSLIRALSSLLSSLGPSRFHISIYENGSKDTTPQQLFLLAKLLRQLGAGFTIVSDPQAPAGWPEGKRIDGLAAVRNRMMQPLYDAPAGTWDRVVVLNDIVLCEADLLEVLLQEEVQEADMTCGMDFKELRIPEFEEQGYPLNFYDVWVARDMQGLPFYNIKYPTGDWELPSRVMPQSASRFRYDSLLPTQVFSSWNGVTVLRASLFHAPHSLRFRSHEHSDTHSECYLFCRDAWAALSPLDLDGTPREGSEYRGARIQIVPRASVGYSVGEYEKARKDRNTTAFELDGQERLEANRAEMVEWSPWPPKLVTTYPYGHWANQARCPSSALSLHRD